MSACRAAISAAKWLKNPEIWLPLFPMPESTPPEFKRPDIALPMFPRPEVSTAGCRTWPFRKPETLWPLTPRLFKKPEVLGVEIQLEG